MPSGMGLSSAARVSILLTPFLSGSPCRVPASVFLVAHMSQGRFLSTLDASGISVSVRQGQVTLSGEVSLGSQKELAERTAESLYGVREVKDDLRVAGH